MEQILSIVQILISLALIAIILGQRKGGGLGNLFGGGGGPTITKTRRGLEKTLFNITIGLSIAFLANAILVVMLFG